MNVTLVMLTLGIWVGVVRVLICEDRTDRFLWIPVVLAVAGLFSSILPLAISLETALVTNGVLLTLFIVALESFTPKHRHADAVAKYRAR